MKKYGDSKEGTWKEVSQREEEKLSKSEADKWGFTKDYNPNDDVEMDEHHELKKLEEVLEYIKSDNEYTEDIFDQIQWLEEMVCHINDMYEKHGKNFQCQFNSRKEKVEESFFEFTDSLTEDLGMILEGIFLRRNRLRKKNV